MGKISHGAVCWSDSLPRLWTCWTQNKYSTHFMVLVVNIKSYLIKQIPNKIQNSLQNCVTNRQTVPTIPTQSLQFSKSSCEFYAYAVLCFLNKIMFHVFLVEDIVCICLLNGICPFYPKGSTKTTAFSWIQKLFN
jgi:hypothetical protein